MTADGSSSRPAHNETARRYFEHSSADRVNTDAVIVDTLRQEYPNLHLTVVPQSSCHLRAYAAAGHAALAPIDDEKSRLSWRTFIPPTRRLNGDMGVLADTTLFGKYLFEWKRREFVLYIVNGRDGFNSYPSITNQYILSSSIDATNNLILEASRWGVELHNEVWVFDGGRWVKSKELWSSVQKSKWDDVILEEEMKDAIIKDVTNFFNSRETYQKLSVPWKRGILFFGPPGNGKTISIRAIMNSLYGRVNSIPTLYVRSLSSFGGPEYALHEIFGKARQTAPCFLVFEDLDSIVTDNVRSYFLNEVDGLKSNDGILMDRLDPGISKRPSRFDRKYYFPDPDMQQREKYCHYWQKKLSDNKEVEFPDELCTAIAKITDDFSFAYIQEAFIAALLTIAAYNGEPDSQCWNQRTKTLMWESAVQRAVESTIDEPKLENLVLWREIKKQVKILREEMEGK
ncbi:hypothetical protein LTR50_005769 [Elasticomyces elasticus]|nr:hypothetical protein LTR50_005769 [Elasticomyces elasticus]